MVALSHIVLKVLVIVIYSLSEVNGSFWDHVLGIPQIKSAVQKIYGDFEGAHETHTNYDSTNTLRAIDHHIEGNHKPTSGIRTNFGKQADGVVDSTSTGDIANRVGAGTFKAVAAETSGDVVASRIITGKDPCCIQKI
jgi:hypothetical protein